MQKDDVAKWLNTMNIKGYDIEDNLSVNAQNVDISRKMLKELPVQFNHIEGNFFCNNNSLISLKNSPSRVDGNFNCSWNKLTDLTHAPKAIKGSLNASFNLLVSLENCPQANNIEVQYNKLINLLGSPIFINGKFDCSHNSLKSLQGAPITVGGKFNCSYNFLKNLKDCPVRVLDNFDCSFNTIESLSYSPDFVGYDFIMQQSHKFDCLNNFYDEDDQIECRFSILKPILLHEKLKFLNDSKKSGVLVKI